MHYTILISKKNELIGIYDINKTAHLANFTNEYSLIHKASEFNKDLALWKVNISRRRYNKLWRKYTKK